MPALPLRWIAVVAGVGVCAACANTPTTPTPSPTPTPAPAAPAPPAAVTVSGVVLEVLEGGGTRPVPNLRLHVRAGSTMDGAVGGPSLPDVITDANGRYTVSNVSAYILFLQTDASATHRFLCDWIPILLRGGFYDLPVVASSWSGTKPPAGIWFLGGSTYGTVTDTVNGGPVAGAAVWLDSGSQDPETLTAANGFYMICSMVGSDQMRFVSVQKSGYDKQVREFIGGGQAEISFQLTRSK